MFSHLMVIILNLYWMKKRIAKVLRRVAAQSLEFADKDTLKRKYSQLKKAWKKNVKNGKRTN